MSKVSSLGTNWTGPVTDLWKQKSLCRMPGREEGQPMTLNFIVSSLRVLGHLSGEIGRQLEAQV